jgi:uncharacterized protein YggE
MSFDDLVANQTVGGYSSASFGYQVGNFIASVKMRSMQCRKAVAHSLVGWFAILTAFVAGQDRAGQDKNSHYVTVSGKGKVKVAATSVELLGTIFSDAELAGDALTKFRTQKETAVKAIKKLELPNLGVETSSFAVGPSTPIDSSSQVLLRARGGTPEPPKIVVQESVRIRISGIDKLDRVKLMETMAKIIDAAKESGVTFGPPPGSNRISITRDEYQGFATFMVDDPQAYREQAEAQAMEDAKVKATRLAKLSGGTLRGVLTIRESTYIPSPLRPSTPEQSPKLDEIEFATTLEVQFGLGTDGSDSK